MSSNYWNTGTRLRALLLVLALVLGLVVLAPGAARAAGPSCSVNGAGGADYTSIQAAVDDTGCTTISVAEGIYAEHVTIARDVTISGAGASSTTVDGTQSGRVFTITSSTVTLQNLTIANGLCSDCNGGGLSNDRGTVHVNHSTFSGNSAACSSFCVTLGGGIYNNGGSVTVSDSSFSSNSAIAGGGIHNNGGGTLTVSDSSFSANSSGGDGGGINNFFSGTLTVSDSSFSANSSGGDGGGIISSQGTAKVSNSTFTGNSGYEGGGIMNIHGTLEVSNSIFSGNNADRYGGGGIDSAGDRLTVTNSTFSGNSGGIGGGIFIAGATSGVSSVIGSTFSGNTAERGGGLYNLHSTMTVVNSTFSGNTAERGGGTYHYSGGEMDGGTMALQHITFAGNSASELGNSIFVADATTTIENVLLADSGPGGNCAVENSLIASGSNFSSDYSCGLDPASSGIDLRLDPDGLKDNGGPTQTIALLPDSPAIDAVTGDCPDTDQRGVERPQGTACDSGAFELQVDTAAPTITISSPADRAVYQLGQSVAASYACQDEQGGSGLASCTGTVASGASIDTASVGSHTFTVNAADNAGNSASKSVIYQVVYSWSGFLQPVDNAPTVNSTKAGSAVPVKFSLSGNYGLNIFASGYPKVQQVACGSGAATDEVEQTLTAGASGLSYDAATGQYSYTWKTDKKWAGSCRQLILKLVDGSEHIASFQFR